MHPLGDSLKSDRRAALLCDQLADIQTQTYPVELSFGREIGIEYLRFILNIDDAAVIAEIEAIDPAFNPPLYPYLRRLDTPLQRNILGIGEDIQDLF
ncbi:MAG: hypothetical protein IE916_09015 [Epsilonproteobacteria bacterium]|nr:hypothetical protein [Campylobacterota bacterium]